MEAIQAPSAWSYSNRFSHIDVAVVDTGFDLDHEDLKGVFRPSSILAESRNDYRDFDDKTGNTYVNNHGTHVSGTIGAIDNNKKGVTGLLWDTTIYYTDWSPYSKEQQWDTLNSLLYSLICSVEAGAKVINYSVGLDFVVNNEIFQDQCDSDISKVDFVQETKDEYAKQPSAAMAMLLKQGYDFLVVQAAGNGASVEIEPGVWETVAVDATNNGLFSSINKDNVVAPDDMKQQVLDRIIIVGAAKRNADGNYQQRVTSNGGDRVDICAPGENVYSTYVNDSYGEMSGTSMAAPHVTGVCGMVWSVNPEFTGAEVKAILCDEKNTTQKVYDNPDYYHPLVNEYRLVNAKLAVKEAIRRTDNQGTITGTIKAKGNLSVSEEVAVPDATIEIVNALSLPGRPQETRKYTSNENGVFNISIEPGVYDITISKLGYETLELEEITVTEQKITDLGDIYLKSISEEPSVEPGIPDTAVEFNRHYYQVYDTPMTWDEAKAYCESLGGHLVTITSDTEQEFVETLIANGKKKSYWLGGTDAANEGTWEWITGEKFDYTNWREFMPDNWQNEDYLMMYKEMDPSYTGETFGRWNDLKSDGTCPGNSYFSKDIFGFICEWDTESSQTGTCITQMEITDHDQYTGNQGDSCVFHLDRSGLPGKDNDYYRNGNIGLDGTEYNNGLEVWIARWNFREEISWAYATYKLDGKYTKLTGRTSLIQSANTDNFDTTIYFYDGDTLLQSYTLTNEDYERQIDVDVTGVNELKILVQDNKAVMRGTSFALYDMFLK